MSSSVGMMTFPTEWKVIKFHVSKPPTRLLLLYNIIITNSAGYCLINNNSNGFFMVRWAKHDWLVVSIPLKNMSIMIYMSINSSHISNYRYTRLVDIPDEEHPFSEDIRHTTKANHGRAVIQMFCHRPCRPRGHVSTLNPYKIPKSL